MIRSDKDVEMVVEFSPDDVGWLIFGYIASGAVLLALLVAGVLAAVRRIRGRPLSRPGKRAQRHATVSALVMLVGLLALSVGLGGMAPAFTLFLLARPAVALATARRDWSAVGGVA